MELEAAVKLWEKLGIVSARMHFNCGGDSMNDTDWEFEDENGLVSCPELESYFDDEVYRRVNFYEASDGHYMGEFGTVEVELDDSDENDVFFNYYKNAQSEWEEAIANEVEVELTEEEADYVKEYVSNINGGESEVVNFNYKKDFIKTDAMEELESEIAKKVDEFTQNYVPEDCYDVRDFYHFESDCEFNGNSVIINMTNYDYVITDSEDY